MFRIKGLTVEIFLIVMGDS